MFYHETCGLLPLASWTATRQGVCLTLSSFLFYLCLVSHLQWCLMHFFPMVSCCFILFWHVYMYCGINFYLFFKEILQNLQMAKSRLEVTISCAEVFLWTFVECGTCICFHISQKFIYHGVLLECNWIITTLYLKEE